MPYTLRPDGNPLTSIPFLPNAGLLGLRRGLGSLGYTLLPTNDLQAEVFRVGQGGYTTYIDQSTGQTYVSGVHAANGNSITLTAQQFLDFVNQGILAANQSLLPPQYIPASAGTVDQSGPVVNPVNPNLNLPVTGAVATPTPTAQVKTAPSSSTNIISTNSNQSAPSGTDASTPWYDVTEFGIPTWGLLTAGVGLAALFFMQHKGGR